MAHQSLIRTRSHSVGRGAPVYARGLLDPSIVRTGYLPTHRLLDAVLNRSAALVLVLLLLPAFLMITAINAVTSGRPILSRSPRIGKNGTTFQILKFRTRQVSADRAARGPETPFGAYLRMTRLDELPQLLNVLRGDMAIFGPRPIQPEQVALFSAQSPGFETRFRVRPGLIGYAGALFPNSASKRLRGRFNTMGCNAPINYGAAAAFVAVVGWNLLRRSVMDMGFALRATLSRSDPRAPVSAGTGNPRDVTVQIGNAPGAAVDGSLVTLADTLLQFETMAPLAPGPTTIELVRRTRRGRLVHMALPARIKTVAPLETGEAGYTGYATLEPLGAYDRYRLERYFMDKTLLPA